MAVDVAVRAIVVYDSLFFREPQVTIATLSVIQSMSLSFFVGVSLNHSNVIMPR